ncbi:MAG: hypothetical protein ACC662_05980 [Planctomycetota bacterium]
MMEIVFLCLEGGKRLYGVRRQGLEIFAGTRDECDRFLDLHRRKAAAEREDDQRPHRARPYLARTYHVSKMHA